MVYLCPMCFTEFKRSPSEVKRVKTSYCSQSCRSRAQIKRDELSPFRLPLKRIQKNSKRTGIEVRVTLEDLKKQWEIQNGICPISGLKLYLPPTSNLRKGKPDLDQASLDRIDSSGHYEPGNIQWIALMANYAKNGWNDERLIWFCKKVAKYHAQRD